MVAPWTLGRIILAETLHRRPPARVPEPAMVMDDVEHVADYASAGDDAGTMTPTHLLHSAQAAAIIKPGDRVLDLGCGPGAQLMQLASLCPEARFVGVDLSEPMLERARTRARQAGLTNLHWFQADITALDRFGDASFDVIVSSMTLHHLPETRDLRRCFVHARRVLKRGGRIYFADFARLRSAWAMRALAHMRAATQPPAFTEDYHNSLRAAFSTQQFHDTADASGLTDLARARQYVTRPLGIMQIIQSQAPAELDPNLVHRLAERCRVLTNTARSDLDTLLALFRRGGLETVLGGVRG
ncbi:MAG: class I SAM-dependent methyltransferase [Phycisphaeraceae bacterium]